MSANHKISRVVDTAYARALALMLSDLGPHASIESTFGAPVGDASVGDVRIQIDSPAIWQFTSSGWAKLPVAGAPGPQGNVGPEGPEGEQGDTGPSDAFGNVLASVPGGVAAVGSRATLGLNSGFTGIQSQPVPTPDNLLTSLSRTRVATAAPGVGQLVAVRNGLGQWWRGNAASLGGFDVSWQFALTAFGVGFRAFVGFRAIVTLIPDVNPTTLVNTMGIGFDAGGTQWAIIHNDAAGAATVVPLNASFNVATTDLIELQLIAAQNGATVDWIARNLSTGATLAGVIAANLPANTIFLSSHVWTSTGTNAVVAASQDLVDIITDTPTPST